jgi:hypothetical protein
MAVSILEESQDYPICHADQLNRVDWYLNEFDGYSAARILRFLRNGLNRGYDFMHFFLSFLVLSALTLGGCASSGNVSPLVWCDRPSDHDARIFTDCTPPIGGDSPQRRYIQDRQFNDYRESRGR